MSVYNRECFRDIFIRLVRNLSESNVRKIPATTFPATWDDAVRGLTVLPVASSERPDNQRLDEQDLKNAEAIYNARKVNETSVESLESTGSVGNNFIEQFIER